MEILEIDNKKVREEQVARLQNLRAGRDQQKCDIALDLLAKCAQSDDHNLLEAAIDAARARASVGEITEALAKAFNRHNATAQPVAGIYSALRASDAAYVDAVQAVLLTQETGGAPKILITNIGQDGHDRGAQVVASILTDLGWEVILAPSFQTPEEIADLAISNDVEMVGVSSLVAGHKTLVPDVITYLQSKEREDILVVVGGVIPNGDHDFLRESGVADIFTPGSDGLDIANSLNSLIKDRRHRLHNRK